MKPPSNEENRNAAENESVPAPPRRSTRAKRVAVVTVEDGKEKTIRPKNKRLKKVKAESCIEEDEPEKSSEVSESEEEPPKKVARKKTTAQKTASKTNSKNKMPKRAKGEESDENADKNDVVGTQKKPAPRKRTAIKDVRGNDSGDSSPPKKVKAPAHQVLTDRDEIPKLWDASRAPPDSYTIKIASWNVAGLRAVIKKYPNILADLVKQHNIDILCLQETKLQKSHVDDPKFEVPHLKDEGYQSYYSCSVAKKGYSGTAVFVRNCYVKQPTNDCEDKKKKTKRQGTMDQFLAKPAVTTKSTSNVKEVSNQNKNLPVLENVTYSMGIEKHDAEGRLVVLDFSAFTLCNVYVPNSGQNLDRLSYRTDEWDKDLLQFMQSRQRDRQVPVMWAGDLNVAHTHLEVWNDGAKHLPKQAGVTPEERASFQSQLDTGFVDAFRRLHPTAAGHYSYWSTRAGNRTPNKGLRLDYFVCDPALFDESSQVVVRDSYMLYDQMGSDHCPVVLELEVKGTH